ncbi:hypothetical protein JRC04_04755 [Mycolicibacterium sp. S2-37]|uniref:hypothetical protein n=1 Tax=Mycolicibacterium sp. S2-37 TaxID=2810297 RepID=UPI001A93E621|nr:hypothetical protein [Mycolicibacterium sp. S2-37]MBO0676769.1 hypothetical protein [Mycolicibacterium sp. S2-37]
MSDAAVTLIADNLSCLPHPDGTELRFVNFATFPGQPDEMQEQIRGVSMGIAEAIVHLLSKNGKAIVDESNLAQPKMYGADRAALKIICKICGGALLETFMSKDGVASVPVRVFKDNVAKTKCRCISD